MKILWKTCLAKILTLDSCSVKDSEFKQTTLDDDPYLDCHCWKEIAIYQIRSHACICHRWLSENISLNDDIRFRCRDLCSRKFCDQSHLQWQIAVWGRILGRFFCRVSYCERSHQSYARKYVCLVVQWLKRGSWTPLDQSSLYSGISRVSDFDALFHKTLCQWWRKNQECGHIYLI